MALTKEQEEFAIEEEGISTGFVALIISVITFFVIVIVVVAINIAPLEFERARLTAIANTEYPLQQETKSAADEKLTGYESVDPANGVYRLPIDEAMKIVVAEAAEKAAASTNSANQ